MSKFIVRVVLLFCTFLLVQVYGKNVYGVRQGRRWFGYTFTETKIQRDIVTSLVPSSCVQVEATLPPCRGVRNLDPFPEFLGTRIYPELIRGRQLVQDPISNPDPKKHSQIVLAPINTTTIGWAEYLGLVAPTVTVTAIQLETTTVLDPRTVVTFSVKGCRPSRLPMDLDRCPMRTGFSIEEVLPTPTVPHLITPTARSESSFKNDLHENHLQPLKKSKYIQIEPSTLDFSEGSSTIPTEELSNVGIKK